MLNPSFDERILGFKKWSNFVEDAVNHGIIEIETKSSMKLLNTKKKTSKVAKTKQPKAFEVLVEVLVSLDKEKKPIFRKFASVADELYNKIPFS